MTSDFQPEPHNRARNYRGQLRSRNHALAVSQSDQEKHPEIPPLPLVPRGEPRIISSDSELAALLATIVSRGRFGYDSEFIGEQSYFPFLCLVQVVLEEEVVLLDPLAGLNMRPFWEILTDPNVEKVVHAGQQDLEPVFRLCGKAAANVFDTQVAAAFLARNYPIALHRLVQEFVGVQLGQGLKFSQWDRRPLTGNQLHYAANDVRFLLALRHQMGQKLEQLEHQSWSRQECDSLCLDAACRSDALQQMQRMRGAAFLRRRQLALLRELLQWRDQAAREQDMPPRTFLKDAIILDLARRAVTELGQLEDVRGLPRPVEARYGPALLALTRKVENLPDDELPALIRTDLDDQANSLIDQAWEQIQKRCWEKGVDPALAASKRELGSLYRHMLLPAEQRLEQRLTCSWRQELLGDLLSPLVQAAGARV